MAITSTNTNSDRDDKGVRYVNAWVGGDKGWKARGWNGKGNLL